MTRVSFPLVWKGLFLEETANHRIPPIAGGDLAPRCHPPPAPEQPQGQKAQRLSASRPRSLSISHTHRWRNNLLGSCIRDCGASQ